MVTKGTWKYTEELDANFSMISDGQSVVCGMPNPSPSGDAETDRRELAFMRANANLIKAAPDMLEALKLILRNREIGEHESQKMGLPRMMEVNELGRAAIAKAEGK